LVLSTWHWPTAPTLDICLGLARQHHRPVALLCTSGTAGANYFPAVIEAQALPELFMRFALHYTKKV